MSTPFAFKFRWYVTLACSLHLALLPRPARCHLGSISDAEDIPLAVGGLPLGPDPDLQFAHPRICKQSPRRHNGAAVDAIVYKFVGAQIEDGRDQGQEGAPRRGEGPRGRPLHHFLAPDGATYVLYIYFGFYRPDGSPCNFLLN